MVELSDMYTKANSMQKKKLVSFMYTNANVDMEYQYMTTWRSNQ